MVHCRASHEDLCAVPAPFSQTVSNLILNDSLIVLPQEESLRLLDYVSFVLEQQEGYCQLV